MKLKAIILGIIAAALLFSCYPLVSPMQPRTNPNDSKNVVPIATSFTANYNTGSGNVDLAWAPYDPTDFQWHRDGYVIIRKTGSAPANVYDGMVVSDPFGNQDASFEDGGAGAGYVNYYGLFAFWKEDDSNETLGHNETGTIENTDGYVFSGPVTTSVGVPEERTIQLPIAKEKSINNSDTWEDKMLYTAKSMTDIVTSVAILQFDTTDIEGGEITGVELSLKNKNTVAYDYSNSIHMDSITSNWDGTEIFSTVTNSDFIDTEASFTFSLGGLSIGSTTTISGPEIVAIVQAWADGLDRYGLRIMVDSMVAPAMDYEWEMYDSDDGVSSQPVLEVTGIYYPE